MSFDFERLIPMFGIPKTEAPTVDLTGIMAQLSAIRSEITEVDNKAIAANSILESNKEKLEESLKYVKNRHKVSISDGTETIYDDNGATPLRIFDLLDSDGNPITKTTDIVEAVPR